MNQVLAEMADRDEAGGWLTMEKQANFTSGRFDALRWLTPFRKPVT
jgi:hypothetical protein